MHVLRLTVYLLLGLLSSANAGESLSFEYSFGKRLVLSESGQRFQLAITNLTDQNIACGIYSLVDTESPGSFPGRVVFWPLNDGANCFGGTCLSNISPPPRSVVWASIGPFAPGETKQCEFEVIILEEFKDDILLTGPGTGGPVGVIFANAVPVMSTVGALFMVIGLVALRAVAFVRARTKEP